VLWAKSGDDPLSAEGHGLLAHLLDVAAVAEVLLERESPTSLEWAARGFGLPVEYCAGWLASLAGLHDYGKAIPGFQVKWEIGRKAVEAHGLSFSPSTSLEVSNHSMATAALLVRPLAQVSGVLPGEFLLHAVQAISAHHGYHFKSVELKKPRREPESWGKAREELLTSYWQFLAPQGLPTSEELLLPVANWLAGLTSVADWIASNVEWFPLGERFDLLSDYYADAKRRAGSALDSIGWRDTQVLLSDLSSVEASGLIGKILGRDHIVPRPLQEVGDRLLRTARGPSLLLVEAPMGEGKTELAFLAHLRLQAINAHRGLYVAMPTQATGNALFYRASAFLKNVSTSRTDIQLVHGGAAMNQELIRLRQINSGNTAEQETLTSSAWFAQRKRPLLSPYGVGTVDQALFGVLNVKHHFVRLWGLRNRVVVLDEVHAYDTYTGRLIVDLVKVLRAMGCSVVLMSATLPRENRDELLGAWGVASDDIPRLSYPRLLLADESGLRGESFEARPLPDVFLEGVEESIEGIGQKAVELLQSGGCGAVIVNTVDRAQQLYVQVREKLPHEVTIVLFHARFPMGERSEIESKVLSIFGENGSRPKRALLIATQVAEQSLDIDFDFMLSDLAPVDLLLQRIGRLHRHIRIRPEAHLEARIWIAGLKSDFPDLETTKWSYVYDAYTLVGTWAALLKEQVLCFSSDIDRLVQLVYDDGFLGDEMKGRLDELFGQYLARRKNDRQLAQNIRIDIESETHSAYDNKPRGGDPDEELMQRNATRLGECSIIVIPVEVQCDGQWGVCGTVFDKDGEISDVLARHLYSRQIRISRKDLVAHFGETKVPSSFATHPLLRNLYPLPLRNGAYETDRLRLRLDREIGLIYEHK